MTLDIDEKIQELKEKLDKAKNDEVHSQMPKWYQYIVEWFYESDIERLEAIKNKKFHVTMRLEVHCETFSTKDFPVAEFDLTDDYTAQIALKDFRRRENAKKDSNLA
jgi:hypothetical protein